MFGLTMVAMGASIFMIGYGTNIVYYHEKNDDDITIDEKTGQSKYKPIEEDDESEYKPTNSDWTKIYHSILFFIKFYLHVLHILDLYLVLSYQNQPRSNMNI